MNLIHVSGKQDANSGSVGSKIYVSEYCNITSFPLLPLCIVWRRRIKEYFYSMAVCKDGWHGIGLSSHWSSWVNVSHLVPSFLEHLLSMPPWCNWTSIFHSFVSSLCMQLLGVLYNMASENVVVSRSLLIICSEACLCEWVEEGSQLQPAFMAGDYGDSG